MRNFEIIFCVFLICFVSCKNIEKQKEIIIKIEVVETYSSLDLWKYLAEANGIIRKEQLDSISKKVTGVSLLDKMNKQNSEEGKSNIETIDNFPLFKILSISSKRNKSNENVLDTSAIIGYTSDSLLFLDLIRKTSVNALFPNDINWRFYRLYQIEMYSAVAQKKDSKFVNIPLSDVDSVIILPSLFRSLGKTVEQLSKKQEIQSYEPTWMIINTKYSDIFKDKSYSVIMTIDTSIYVGSITMLNQKPNQRIYFNELKSEDVDVLQQLMKDKFKMIK